MGKFLSSSSSSTWRKIVAGGGTRKSRFHDELGALVSGSRLLRNAPRALVTGLIRTSLGYRPGRPWISYDAQAELARFLKPISSVLEFGSGMSTLWYARHSGAVVSIEDHAGWFETVGPRVRAAGNVEYVFAEGRQAYVGAAPDKAFDLIMIDGNWRDDCARFAVTHLAPGGIIYLDNADMGASLPTGDLPEASRLLREFARINGLRVREFTDFAPTQLHAQRGLMIGG